VVEVAHHWWRSEERTLRDPTDLSQLRADLLQAERLDAGLVRLVLNVAPHSQISSAELEELRQQLDASLFELDWRLTVGCDAAVSLPPGVLTEVDAALALLSQGQSFDSVSLPLAREQAEALASEQQLPQVASAARRLLRQLIEAES
jgi:hypothetical protein